MEKTYYKAKPINENIDLAIFTPAETSYIIESVECEKLLKEVSEGADRIIYFNPKTGKFKVRDRLYSKYNEKTGDWDEDVEAKKNAIEQSRQDKLKQLAQSILDDPRYSSDYEDLVDLTNAQKAQILSYRKYLKSIVNGLQELKDVVELKDFDFFKSN
jgi:hypothetical protein